MALKVERLVVGGNIVLLRVSGRIEAEHVDTLRKPVEEESGKVVIDLREVTLVNREAIRFLAFSEAHGVELKNCADYIGEWISRERRRKQNTN
jgi:anti-anti-sigma regulatory factor